MNDWPKIALSEVIDHRKEFIIIDDLETYRRPRVQLHAQGIVLRDAVQGAQIKTKKQQVARAGEFLVAEIDAKVGGFGVVPNDLDGSIVSSHYFLYRHKPDRLNNRYLGWFAKTRAFRLQVEAQGSTNYAAIRPDDVLGYEIPLPPLDEQSRIVDRLDTLAKKAQQIEEHLDAVERDAELLLALRFRDTTYNAPLRPIFEAAPFLRRPVEIHVTARYREIGARSFGKGLFAKPDFDGATATWEKPIWVKSGDLVLSNIKAWEGAIAVASNAHDGCIASHRYITCVPDPMKATAGFLAYYLLSEDGLAKVNSASPGTADRNRTLSLGKLGKIEVPLPTLAAQQSFDRLHAEITNLKARHTSIRAANSALLPATLERVFT
ncbi:restriction endonuclease subunit S [Bradyrhizobium sp. Pear77]|uniref:restriction endonuclease subunit S n=1 Tax=Bradyrhizobium altum TaxID=1571202 RepID=UPI00289BE3DB|nr:restriction endonuclease subunit S [Bradyrhizobium altum]MCC8953126.1 restriction endonuclease subunit S [Bradyrhizobium altum]